MPAIIISAANAIFSLIGVVCAAARGSQLTPSYWSYGYGLGFGAVSLCISFILLGVAIAFKMIKEPAAPTGTIGAKVPGQAYVVASPAPVNVVYVPTVQPVVQPAAVAQAV
jgi:hypothetical protein